MLSRAEGMLEGGGLGVKAYETVPMHPKSAGARRVRACRGVSWAVRPYQE